MSEILFKPKLFYRKRIRDILQNITKVPLFLVIANMGYGKTYTVKHFLKLCRNYKQIWLSLHLDETNPKWVWYKFCKAFNPQNDLLSQKLIDYGLPESNEDIVNILHILNELINYNLIFVIDDYSKVEHKYLNDLFIALAYKNIPNFHLVIISRDLSYLPYKPLLTKKLCYVLTQDDIAFTYEEQKEFFKLNDFELNETEQSTLFNYTDGWVAALYLALLSYNQDHNFNSLGTKNNLIKTAFYDKLNLNIKIALMKLSPIETFTFQQALFITKDREAILYIHKIALNNCFIKYDNKFNNYKLHSILRSLVCEELEDSEFDLIELYITYGDWFLKEGELNNALDFYLKSKNYKNLITVIESHSDKIICLEYQYIFDLFKNIPQAELNKYPLVYLIYIHFYIIFIDFDIGTKMFNEFKVKYSDNKFNGNKSKIYIELANLASFVAFDNLTKSITNLSQAIKINQDNISDILYNEMIFTFGIPNSLCIYHKTQGQLNLLTNNLDLLKCNNKIIETLGIEYLLNAEYCYETNNLVSAELFAHKAIFKATSKNQFNLIISCLYILSFISILNAKADDFLDCVDNLINILKNSNNSILVTDAGLVLGYIYSCLGDLDKIPVWILNYDLSQCNSFLRKLDYISIIEAKIACLKNNYIKLEIIAESMIESSKKCGYIFISIFAYIFDSIAKYNLYGIEYAIISLDKALELAESDNIVMPFVENYNELIDILPQMENKYISKILPICKRFKKGITKIKSSKSVTFLTARENQIISLVAKGYKNIEVSEALGIAPVTVEKILSNIYKKLNVTNRTAAISRLKNL